MTTAEIKSEIAALQDEYFWTGVFIRGWEEKLASWHYEDNFTKQIRDHLERQRKHLAEVEAEIATLNDAMALAQNF